MRIYAIIYCGMHALLKGEIMKKLISLFCSVMLICSLCSVTALAADTTSEVDAVAVEETDGASEGIVPFATSRGLWYEEDHTIYMYAVNNMTVTPEKGANLRIWLKNDAEVKITYARTVGGVFVGMGTKTFGPGERDVLLASNCNGSAYQVKMTCTGMMAKYSVLLYQN